MKIKSIAPCGLICDLCYGFQRKKDKCDGCNSNGNINKYCLKCAIKNCSEKIDKSDLCFKCNKYPCKRIKDLEKRYKNKYGESLICNFEQIKEKGIRLFIKEQNEKWKCPDCGMMLCVHKENCANCGKPNTRFPENMRKQNKN